MALRVRRQGERGTRRTEAKPARFRRSWRRQRRRCTPLTDATHGGFIVRIKIFVRATRAGSVKVGVSGSWGSGATNASTFAVTASNSSTPGPDGGTSMRASGDNVLTLELQATAAQVRLWWPNGAGAQPLYNVSVSIDAGGGVGGSVTATRRIGFRAFALVTGAGSRPGEQGTLTNGMYFRVNGAAIFSRGANSA